MSDEGKDASSSFMEYLRQRASLEQEYADRLYALVQRFTGNLPAYWAPIKTAVQDEMGQQMDAHRRLGSTLSREIELPLRQVNDEINLRQMKNFAFIDELVRASPGFVIPSGERANAATLGERALDMERARCDKLQFACDILRSTFQSPPKKGITSMKEGMEAALAGMPIVRDSRWKPYVEIKYEPLGDALRFEGEEAGWDTEAHAAFPTLADNPGAAQVIEALPEVSSLNILIDHMVVHDLGKPLFHQPTRDPLRNAMLAAIKKEAEGSGLRFEDVDFFYVIGSNQSAHVALPSTIVDKMAQRLANQLGLRHDSQAGQAARLANYADIRIKKFKKPGELTKTMTKADRTTDNFRIGAEQLKKMSNLGQFGKLVSFDLEGWELGSHLITELGFTVYEPASNKLTAHHYIISENAHLKNGNIMPSHRDQFLHGASEELSLADAFARLLEELKGDRVALVGHGLASDLTMILNAGLPRLPLEGLTQLDTQILFLQVQRASDQSSLEKVLEHFAIPSRYLHNAGNDAFYTLLVCLRLAGIDLEPFTQY